MLNTENKKTGRSIPALMFYVRRTSGILSQAASPHVVISVFSVCMIGLKSNPYKKNVIIFILLVAMRQNNDSGSPDTPSVRFQMIVDRP